MPTYKLRGVNINFPYDAYECQLAYMEKVVEALQKEENALLESPTGTGKTLCLLCATLGWRESLKEEYKNKAVEVKAEKKESYLVQGLREDQAQLMVDKAESGEGLPTIIYSSRTHSQIKQVIDELKSTSYKVKTAVLSSRQQTCMHTHVQNLNGTVANHACRSLVMKRGCRWYNNTENFLKNNGDLLEKNLDIEDLVKVGASRTVCPYFLSRGMTASADVIFMPYNYLIDVKTRTGLGIKWNDAVLIFDEAHNIESVCSEAGSFDLPLLIVSGAIEEIGTAAEIVETRGEGFRQVIKGTGDASSLDTSTNLRQLQFVLKKLEEVISAIEIPQGGITKSGEYIFRIFDGIGLNHKTFQALNSVMDIAMDILSQDAIHAGRKINSNTSALKLHALQEALNLLFFGGSMGSERDLSGYRVHVRVEKHQGSELYLPTLSFWCFDPGEGMKAIQDLNIRSILLTSGTLSPLGSFAQELGTPFKVRLENPHVIDTSQVWVGVVSKGPQGSTLNSSFKTRNDASYRQDLGNAIVNFSRIVPDGMLVFFPSYGLLKSCVDAWKDIGTGGASVWERISQHKAPVVEPRDSASFPMAAADFKSKLDDPRYNGAIFFGVCRGKASEGLDFSDRAGRAVVITGIPFATMTDPKVKIKKEVMDTNLRGPRKRSKEEAGDCEFVDEYISGDAWYVQQAMRAVNQAIGRVIRHINDYGAIILCDERFGGQRIQQQLSRWLRDDVVTYQSYGAASSSLTKFFKDKSGLSDSRKTTTTPMSKPKQAFVGASRGPQQSGINLEKVPNAVDTLGMTELFGHVAKKPMPKDTQRGESGSACSRLLGLLGDASNRTSCSAPNAHRNKAATTSGIDSLLVNNAPNQSTKSFTNHKLGSSDPTRNVRPWERSQHRVNTEKHTQTRMLIKKEPSASIEQHAPPSNVLGPKHLIEKHQTNKPQVRSPPEKPTRTAPRSIHGATPQIAKPDSFIAELKQKLPKENFKRISQALRAYMKEKDHHALIRVASEELHHIRYAKLCEIFKQYFPKEHRPLYDRAVKTWRAKTQSTNQSVTPSQVVQPIAPPARQAPHHILSAAIERAQKLKNVQNLVNHEKDGAPSTSCTPSCPVCSSQPIRSPFTTSCCKTIACYSCLLQGVALKQCPGCKKPLRKSMLSKLYFKESKSM